MTRPLSMLRASMKPLVLATWTVLFAGAIAGCDPESDDGVASREAPDARIQLRPLLAGKPTPAGLAFARAAARAHAEADAAADPAQRVAILRAALAEPVPADMPEAEVLRLELAARLGETLGERPEGAAAGIDLLVPMLRPDRVLPRDRATARALVTLGDLAVETGDDALAAGSYMRAIRVMSSLRQELVR